MDSTLTDHTLSPSTNLYELASLLARAYLRHRGRSRMESDFSDLASPRPSNPGHIAGIPRASSELTDGT